MSDAVLAAAARAIAAADALVITAGAGMGVDSGLPDFRGDEGFWRAYPPFRALGLSFVDLANPRWFARDPELAWGFYGHRLMLYRRTVPHAGFGRLRAWCGARPHGGFVFTSNVDGQFERAGFAADALVACHGSLGRLQCTRCDAAPWSAAALTVDIDDTTMRARPPLPTCPRCGALARPNVLMFGDGAWDGQITAAEEDRFAAFLARTPPARTCVIELGAGTAVPTVRLTGEALAARGATLVRVNVREAHGPRGTLSLALGADDATRRLDALLAADLA